MATRRGFDPSADPKDIDDAPKGKVMQSTCFANGCVLPGSIRVDGSGSWTCAMHYAVQPSDLPRVTQVLKDWECLTYELTVGRSALVGPMATDGRALDKLYSEAAERVAVATAGGGWGDVFDRKPGLDYRTWLLRLEHFLGGRVHATLTGTPA